MKTSAQTDLLAAALAKAQGELAGAKKDQANPFFKSKYADLASVVDALKACFPKHGLSYVQTVVVAENGAGVQTRLMHSSGQFIEGEPFVLPVNKVDAQGFGSCVTYARRYDLAAMTGVAPEDDDGNAAAAAKPERKDSARQVTVDAFESLPKHRQDELREHAQSLVHLHSIKGDMAGYIEAQDYDTEAKLGLWSLLPSDVRSEIKRQQAAAREKAAA